MLISRAASLLPTLLSKRFGRLLGSVLLLLSLLSLTSCSSSEGKWRKIGLKDMQTILPRMLLSEALYDQRALPDSVRILGYQTLLAEYGYNLTDWDSSLVWYGRYRIPEYQKFYETATASLTAQQELLQRRVDSLAQIEARERRWLTGQADSVNLLRDSVSYHQLGKYLERSFSLSPEGTYPEGTEVHMVVRLAGLPKQIAGNTLRLQLQLLYADSTARTLELKPLHNGLNKLSFVLPAGKQLRQARGVLRGVAPRGQGKWFAVDSFSFARFPGGMMMPPAELPSPTPEVADAPDTIPGEDELAF